LLELGHRSGQIALLSQLAGMVHARRLRERRRGRQQPKTDRGRGGRAK